MSAIDKLRSFAESRSHDHVIIRDGLTYRDAREIVECIARMEADNDRGRASIQNLAAIIRRLCSALRETGHRPVVVASAMEYLRRNGWQGSVIRTMGP